MQPECLEGAVLLDDALSAFVSVRPRLFGIAYRMQGSAAEAEDIVQDVWLRWQTTDRSVILDTPAFLATMTTRLAINLAQSARSRHETYTGTWLPEPANTSDDPHLRAERGEALELAVLLLLEKLSPKERPAYVLREAFDYSHQGIANVLKLTKANIRQLVSRVRKHISNGRRAAVSAVEQWRLLVAFIDAAQKGDTAALEGLFVADIVSYSDGGRVVRAGQMLVSGHSHTGPEVRSNRRDELRNVVTRDTASLLRETSTPGWLLGPCQRRLGRNRNTWGSSREQLRLLLVAIAALALRGPSSASTKSPTFSSLGRREAEVGLGGKGDRKKRDRHTRRCVNLKDRIVRILEYTTNKIGGNDNEYAGGAQNSRAS